MAVRRENRQSCKGNQLSVKNELKKLFIKLDIVLKTRGALRFRLLNNIMLLAF